MKTNYYSTIDALDTDHRPTVSRDRSAIQVAHGLLELWCLLLISMLPPLLVFLDFRLGNGVSEQSLTELTQELLLLGTALLFMVRAKKQPLSRPFYILVAGFFGCLLIRELDAYFDAIRHGFWKWPALALAVGAIFHAWHRGRHSVLPSMARFMGNRNTGYILLGLVMVVGFSRVFGSGSLLWENLVDASYLFEFKSALQEGLELLGYLYIAFGAVMYLLAPPQPVQGHASNQLCTNEQR